MPLPLGRPGAMLLSLSAFRRAVRRCFSHFVAVTLFRVWTMEPHRRTSQRSAPPLLLSDKRGGLVRHAVSCSIPAEHAPPQRVVTPDIPHVRSAAAPV